MPTYTTNKRLVTQAQTENAGTWGAGGSTGDDLNTGVMGLLDSQLAGVAAFSVSSSNVTLSYANVQSAMFRFTGTLLSSITVSPDSGGSPVAATYFNGFYIWENLTSGNFTITVTTGNGSVVLPQGRRGILFVSAASSLAPRIVAMVGSTNADPIPAGSATIWYNTAAPAGWTAVAMNDYAVKIVTTGSGGVTSGSVAYSTLYARTATDATTLTTDQIPSHTHIYSGTCTMEDNNGSSGVIYPLRESSANNLRAFSTASGTEDSIQATGGGNSHTHGLDMRVLTAAFTLATRD